MQKESDDFYDKKIDNELKKKELEEKYGAHFSGGSSDISPEMESSWLKSIEEFEFHHQTAEHKTVYEILGKPAYNKLDQLQPEDVETELKRIYDLLHKGSISLDTLAPVDDKELYRFITDELFEYQMESLNIPGMVSCFTYEEFYPNAELDIEQAIDYFLI